MTGFGVSNEWLEATVATMRRLGIVRYADGGRTIELGPLPVAPEPVIAAEPEPTDEALLYASARPRRAK